MITAIVLSFLAAASAAPQYFHHHRPPMRPPFGPPRDLQMDHYFSDEIFDTRRFWSELSAELAKMDEMLQDFCKHFPSGVSSSDVEGDEYKITIALEGFDEKDIVVKAREGVVMVQAVHKMSDGNQKSYMDLRTLPDFVDVAGSWSYDKGVLKISFPLLRKPTEAPTEAATEATEEPEQHSREEMGGDNSDNQDVDVGLNRGDTEKQTELLTNEIPRRQPVEATTYAVDLKDEVEFVPVKY